MKRLFFKVFGLLLAGFLIVVAITMALLWWVEGELRPGQKRLEEQAQVIAKQVVDGYENNDLDAVLRQVRTDRHVRVWLLDANDQNLGSKPLPQRLRQQVNRYPTLIRPYQSKSGRAHIIATEMRSGDNTYHVIMQTGRRPFRGDESHRFVLIPVVFLLFALVAATLLLSIWILRPLRIIRETAGSISGDTPGKRIPESVTGRKDAFGELGVEFNRMTSRLEQNVDVQRQLVRDISHELRTPLARIQVAASLCAREFGDAEMISRIESEVERLDEMIESLLTLSRLEQQDALDKQPVDLGALIESIADDARFEFQTDGKQVDVDITHHRAVQGDASLLGHAVENIIRNAMRFSPNQGTVTVTTRDEQQAVQILIRDQGPGVEPQLLERIFDPFFQTDQARTQQDANAPNQHGVGLTIAQAIVKLHGGTISASNQTPSGLLIRIDLP